MKLIGVLQSNLLTPELDRFVLKKVKSGSFDNASEVVRAALRTAPRLAPSFPEYRLK